jgi:hypothetical protein
MYKLKRTSINDGIYPREWKITTKKNKNQLKEQNTKKGGGNNKNKYNR